MARDNGIQPDCSCNHASRGANSDPDGSGSDDDVWVCKGEFKTDVIHQCPFKLLLFPIHN